MASDRKHIDACDSQPISIPEGHRTFLRRDFLNGILVASSAVVIGACGDSTKPAASTEGGLEGEAGPDTGVGADLDASADAALDGGSDGIAQETGGDGPSIPKADKGDVYQICHDLRDGKKAALTLPEPLATEPLYDCIVVGGGISGLVAAWKLRKLGYDNILVLEKDEPVGGLSRMDGGTPTFYSRAVAYSVLPYNDDLIELYRDLAMVGSVDDAGVPTMIDQYIVKAPVNSVYMNGRWYLDAWESGMESLPLTPKALEDLKAFRQDLLTWYDFVGTDGKMAFDTPSDASTADANVRALDRLSLSEYILGKGWDQAVVDFFAPYCLSALGTTIDKVSAWAALNFLGSEFGVCLSQPGGNGYLSKRVADLIGPTRIRARAFVLRVKSEGGDVRVTYEQAGVLTTLRAKTVIYAAPRFVARYILPDLVAAGRDEAVEFKYTPFVVANVHVSKTPTGLGYDNWVQSSASFFTDFIIADWAGLADPSKAPESRPNVLTVYCPILGLRARTDVLEKPIEYFEEKVLTDLEKVIPGVRATVTGFELYRWGHAMLSPSKGFVFSPARVNAQVAIGNKVFFACTDVDGLPAFENAVGSAVRAAGQTAAALKTDAGD